MLHRLSAFAKGVEVSRLGRRRDLAAPSARRDADIDHDVRKNL
jgi:hypothetical protein